MRSLVLSSSVKIAFNGLLNASEYGVCARSEGDALDNLWCLCSSGVLTRLNFFSGSHRELGRGTGLLFRHFDMVSTS